MSEDALTLVGVSKHIGGVRILEDVTVSLRPGQRRALIGPNGAGKTTLLNIAAGVIRPSGGQVLLAGRDVTRMPAHRRARRGLARTFQVTTLLPALTVAQNLALAVQATSPVRCDPVRSWRAVGSVWRQVDELVERGDLAALRDVPVSELPYGQQRRLEIVVAVARHCQVVLLDEPGAGLSSPETEELMRLVFGLGEQLAVMFVEHDVELAMRLATDVTVLHLGRMVTEGTPDQIRSSAVLDDIYLGAGQRA
ncbi:MAG TPA: ABC transporter ATP-binding protein [Mycobacteriales bacterium]